jgi:ABC-type Fe3+-hydroxamate transport system substrate-binding protein
LRAGVKTDKPAPQRIVSLVPNMTETLFAFGVGERIVGVTDYCTHPPDGVALKARVGGTKNPNVERIIALRPDLVVVNVEENRKPDADALRAAGIELFVSFPQTVREGLSELRALARVTQSEPAARSILDEFERTLDETERLVAGKPRVRVFCAIWKDPYMTVNGATYISDFVETCGGLNVFHDRLRQFPLAAEYGRAQPLSEQKIGGRDRRYPRVSLAEVAARLPEVILLPDEPHLFSAKDLPDFEQFPDMPAVRAGRVHIIDGKAIAWCGPRSAAGLRLVRRLLEGDG